MNIMPCDICEVRLPTMTVIFHSDGEEFGMCDPCVKDLTNLLGENPQIDVTIMGHVPAQKISEDFFPADAVPPF